MRAVAKNVALSKPCICATLLRATLFILFKYNINNVALSNLGANKEALGDCIYSNYLICDYVFNCLILCVYTICIFFVCI